MRAGSVNSCGRARADGLLACKANSVSGSVSTGLVASFSNCSKESGDLAKLVVSSAGIVVTLAWTLPLDVVFSP